MIKITKFFKILMCTMSSIFIISCGGSDNDSGGDNIVTIDPISPLDGGSIDGSVDYDNSDFIQMSVVGAGELTIEVIPSNSNMDIDCGLTSSIGPSLFQDQNFITDDDGVLMANDSDDSSCSLIANFNNSESFYLFVDVADGPVTSGSYTVFYEYE